MFPIDKVRQDFPILNETVNGKPLIYLDNGATTQKPQAMIDALVKYYSTYNSNVHRGVHTLSQKATDAFEAARKTVQRFIGAQHENEIIFTSGTTDSINMLSTIIGEGIIKPGDRIFVAESEHHSNIVPWQFVCQKHGAELVTIPFVDGQLDFNVYTEELEKGCRFLAIAQISNSMGRVNPVEKMIPLAKEKGALVMLDAAQSVAHGIVDVQKLDCDFYVFSAHKIYGPTGLGVLYGKLDLLESLPPYRGGGEMIEEVKMEKSTYACLPHRLEAGTPNIADVIALQASLEYLENLGISEILAYEKEIINYAFDELSKLDDLIIYGEKENRSGAISFNHNTIHAYDIGTILDKMGIAVRTGNHCAQPVMTSIGITGTIRASFAFYNTKEEVDNLINGLKRAIMMLG